MLLIPSKYDTKNTTVRFLDFHWLSEIYNMPSLSKFVDLSIDPGFMSLLIIRLGAEWIAASIRTFI
jgi:hypothetical protein